MELLALTGSVFFCVGMLTILCSKTLPTTPLFTDKKGFNLIEWITLGGLFMMLVAFPSLVTK